MSKPTEEELDTALTMAARMRDKNVDPFHIAKSLLSHNYRMKYFEEVLKAADRYVNMGMSDRERSNLVKAIEKAKDAESYTAQELRESFGLE